MQLMRTEGDVTVLNAKGRALSVRERLKLHNGYRTDTEEASYAWINLDDEKLTKMDAVSETEIRKNGKKLEIMLKSGKLFFDVEKALTEEETLNIRTSTMAVGIRGTSGWAEVIDSMHSKIYILEGKVECTVSDPVSGEVRSATISSGETAEFVVYEEETNGKQCDILIGNYKEEEIGGFILEELAEKPALCEKIEEASGLKVAEESKKAAERLAADEAKIGAVLANIQTEYVAQVTHVSEDPVWVGGGKVGEQLVDASQQGEEQKAAEDKPKKDKPTVPKKDKTPADSEITPVPTPTIPTEPVPEKQEEKKPAQTAPGTGGGSQNSGGNSDGNTPAADQSFTNFINKWKGYSDENGGFIIDKSSCPEREIVLSGEELLIPQGQTLTLLGIDLNVEQSATLTVNGTLNIKKEPIVTRADAGGNLINAGCSGILRTGVLTVEGNLVNNDNNSATRRIEFYMYGENAQKERQVTIEGQIINNIKACIGVRQGSVLTVGNGLTNEGYLEISGGKLKGKVINQKESERNYADNDSDGLILVTSYGEIDGEVFNNGKYPYIGAQKGGVVKKITDNSQAWGQITIGLDKETGGIVKDGIYTRGIGSIRIYEGSYIGSNGIVALDQPGVTETDKLNVYFNGDDSEADTASSFKTWEVFKEDGKYKVKDWDVTTEPKEYESYSDAINAVNTALQGCLTNSSGSSTSGSAGDGVTYEYSATTNTLTIRGSGPMADYTVSESADNRPWGDKQRGISHVVIEEGVTRIGNYAFNGCAFLEDIRIPNSVTTIGDHAISMCYSLYSVTIPGTVTTLGDYAFNGTHLTSVSIPASVKRIGAYAFNSCRELTEVTIPAEIETIGENSFDWCGKLATVHFSGTKIEWNRWKGYFPVDVNVVCSDGKIIGGRPSADYIPGMERIGDFVTRWSGSSDGSGNYTIDRASCPSDTVTLKSGEGLYIPEGNKLLLRGVDLAVESGTGTLQIGGTLQIEQSGTTGGNLKNYQQVLVNSSGVLKIAGDLNNYNGSDGNSIELIIVGSEQSVGKVTVGGNVTNHENAELSVQCGKLEVQGGLQNKGTLAVFDLQGDTAVVPGEITVKGNATNELGGEIAVSHDGVLIFEGTVLNHKNITVREKGKLEFQNDVTNNIKAEILVQSGGQLKVAAGKTLINEGRLDIMGSNSIMNGTVDNRCTSGASTFEDLDSIGQIYVNQSGKIEGAVTNSGVDPSISLSTGGTIKTIINESIRGNIHISSGATITEGIYTSGGGTINIQKGVSIGWGLKFPDSPEPVASKEELTVEFRIGDPILNTWKIGADVTKETYSNEITKINNEIKPLLTSQN